jgi:murein tripeptide amidase MpaA
MSILKLKPRNGDEKINDNKHYTTPHGDKDGDHDTVDNNHVNVLVNTKFDAGSIEIMDVSDPHNLQFRLEPDTNSHFAQWFYFQLSNVAHKNLGITISGLKDSAYPESWVGYSICASYDNNYWFRVPTVFDGDRLCFSFTPECNTIYFAYFEPYPYQRHLDLISEIGETLVAKHQVLGLTHEGRNIDLLTIGNPDAKHKIWIIARQHPGETMAEWFMEGVFYRLLNAHDAVCRTLLKECIFYCVPNMNPDGAYLGNLRTNSVGTNLNREWLEPSIEKSPEVFYVRQKMLKTGVDMFFDIHGDEELPYVFTAGCVDNPSFSVKQKKLTQAFEGYFPLVNPDYQTKHGYEKGHFNKESATLATNWVGDKFDCLALTLEMPFKDNCQLVDPTYGWNGHRSYTLGASMLTVIHMLIKTEADLL